MKDKFKYVQMWQEQSKQLWSRLQTATVLHSGVLVGWFKIKDSYFAPWILTVGIVFTILIILLMMRDVQYLDSMKMKAAEAFPDTGKKLSGRWIGYIMVGALGLIELYLLLSFYCLSELPLPK